MVVTALIAHQGGWDEILLVAGPMLIVAGLLWTAKRRVAASPARTGSGTVRQPSPTSDPSPGGADGA